MMTENGHSSVMTTACSGSDESSEASACSALHTSSDDGSKLNQLESQSTLSAYKSTILNTQANFNQVPTAKNEQKESMFRCKKEAHSSLIPLERKTVLSSYGCNTTHVLEQFQDIPISECGIKKPCKSSYSSLLLQKDREPSDLSHIPHNTKLKEQLVDYGELRKEGPLSLIVLADSTGSDEHEISLVKAAAMQLQDSHIISPSNRAPQRNSVHCTTDELLTLNSYEKSCSHEIQELIGEPIYSNGTKVQRLPPVSTIMQSRLASSVKEGFKMPFRSSHFVPFTDLSYSHNPHNSEVVCLSTVTRRDASTVVSPISLVSNKMESEGTFVEDSVNLLHCTSLCEAGTTSLVTPHVTSVITPIPDFSKIHSENIINRKDTSGSIQAPVSKFPRMDCRGPLLFGEDGHPIVVPSTNPLLTPLDLGSTTLRMVTSQPSVKINTYQMNRSTFSNRLVSSWPVLGVRTGVITTVGSSYSSSAKAQDLPSKIQEHSSSLIEHVVDVNLPSTASANDSVLEEQEFSEVINRNNSEDGENDVVCKPSSINTDSPIQGIPPSELPSILSSLGSPSSDLVSSGSSGYLMQTKTISSNIPFTTGVSLICGTQSGLTGSHIPRVPPLLLSGILPTSLCRTPVKHEPHEATTSHSVTSTGGLLYSSLSTLPSLVSIFKEESPTDNASGSGPLPPFTVISGMSSLSKKNLAEFVTAQSSFSKSGSHLEEDSVKEEPFDNAETPPSESLSASQSPMLQNTCHLPGLSCSSTIPLTVICTNHQEELSPTLTHTTTVPSQQMTVGFSHTATAPFRNSSTTCIGVASNSLSGSSSGRKIDKKNCQLCQIDKPCSLHSPQSCRVSSNITSGPLLSSDPVKPFQCNICGKNLASKSVYQLHVRSHTGEKPFTCNLCGHNFSQKTSLTRHMRSHTGERPFPCEVCGKCFADKERTKIHMRTHTGEKPFPCKMCGKCFSQKSTVKRHMSVHTGEKPFTCETCGKGFANRGNLNAHGKTHTSNAIM